MTDDPSDRTSNGAQYRVQFDYGSTYDLIYDSYEVSICIGLYDVKVDDVYDGSEMSVDHQTDHVSWCTTEFALGYDARGEPLPMVEYDVPWDDWTMH